MKRFYFLSVLVLSFFFSVGQIPKYLKVKVYAGKSQLLQMAQTGIDITEGSLKKGAYIISDYSEEEIAKIDDLGLSYDILIDDVAKYYAERNIGKSTNVDDYKGTSEWAVPENFEFGSMGGHATYDEIVDHLDNMYTLFPNLITQKESIGQTLEGRDMWVVKISDNPGTQEDEPEVLYTALHHAREPEGAMCLMYYMYYLLENYNSDPFIQTLVDNTQMYFIPVMNPDGYVYNQTTNPNGGGMWRKNRRDVSGSSCYGIDINRNYGYMWGYDNFGSSPDPCDETYRGDSAFSEPEISSVRDFVNQHEFRNALNYHTYGNLLLYAWGYTNQPSPDDAIFAAHSVLYTEDNFYTYGPGSTTIYITNGSSDDWMYGEQVTKPKILSYTPEVGDDNDGFWCDQSRIIPIAQENMIQNIRLAEFAGKYADAVDTSPTIFSETTGAITFDFTRLGLEGGGDFTVSLIPLGSIIQYTGDAVEYNDPALIQTQSGAIGFALDPAVLSGTSFQFLLSVDNGDYVISDTLNKIYGEATAIFEDDCNTNTNWISPTWAVTNATYHSSTGSITDSPSGNYSNNTTSGTTLNQEIDLTSAGYAQLTFWAKWEIEAGYDYVQCLISTNNGTSWTPLAGKYTKPGTGSQLQGQPLYDGNQSTWVQEEIDLSEYIGENVTFRFLLKSDGWVTGDGFYFDDFVVTTVENATIGQSEYFAGSPGVLISNPIPNPATNRVSFYIENRDLTSDLVFNIYNALGDKVYTTKVGLDDISVNISEWQPGIYFYRIGDGKFTSPTGKFITK